MNILKNSRNCCSLEVAKKNSNEKNSNFFYSAYDSGVFIQKNLLCFCIDKKKGHMNVWCLRNRNCIFTISKMYERKTNPYKKNRWIAIILSYVFTLTTSITENMPKNLLFLFHMACFNTKCFALIQLASLAFTIILFLCHLLDILLFYAQNTWVFTQFIPFFYFSAALIQRASGTGKQFLRFIIHSAMNCLKKSSLYTKQANKLVYKKN